MLSKSQAKAFFLIGTAACTIAFVMLSIDSFKQIPRQTHEENLNESVIQGKHLWESNNCMGCHTIMGEGAYYAPELTKVFERRGEMYIRSMLKNPQAMFPTGRQMTNFHFTDKEIDDLVAFLKWIGEADLNGFPAKPDDYGLQKNQTSLTNPIHEEALKPAIFSQVCTACHSVNGSGGQVGPQLDGIGSRRDREYLIRWLHNPQAVKADAKMPQLPLKENDIADLVNYLSQLKEKN